MIPENFTFFIIVLWGSRWPSVEDNRSLLVLPYNNLLLLFLAQEFVVDVWWFLYRL